MSTEIYRIGNLLLNAGTQEVTRDGAPVPLPPLSFSLLLTLARHAPNVVTTAELEAEVWSGLVIDRGTINKRVVLVRKALQKAGCEQDYIAVVRGTGYRLAVPVSRPGEDGALSEQAPADDARRTDTAGRSTPPSYLGWGLTLLAILVLALLLGLHLLEPERGVGPDALAAAEEELATGYSGADSIAVLPFEQPGAEGKDAYFAEGVSREVIRLLGELPSLRVASSASSFGLENSDLSSAEIGERLGVDTLLTGTVHTEGDRIIVMASLLHADSGRTLWADSYDQPAVEVFRIQGDIAGRVASALRLPDMPDPTMREGAVTASIDAYTLYLKGWSQVGERMARGAPALHEALESFQAAVGLDPRFVRAHVGTAAASFLLPSYDDAAERDHWLERAEASARLALDLDPTSSEAMGVLAAIVSWRGDPLRAAGLFDRAMELGSHDANVLHWHAMLATSMGYFEALLPELRDAYRLDPLNQLLGCSLAGSLVFSGQPDEALRVLEGMDRFSRRDLATAVSHLYLGNWMAAREMLRGVELRMGLLPARYADLLVDAFENPPRRAFVEQAFLDGVRAGDLPALVAFEALLVLGSPRAFDLEAPLEDTFFEHRLPEAVWHNWGVELRQDPRFKRWVRALGYDQHWRKYGWPDRCRPTGLNDFECV